jgi:hypothetical protein
MWTYIWSLGLISIGIYIIAKRKLEVGILGRPASLCLRGPYAIIAGVLAVTMDKKGSDLLN